MTAVPEIDLTEARQGGPADRARTARLIDAACQEIGFFTITGHGIDPPLVADLRTAGHAFFAQPLEMKLRCRHPVRGMNRGYHPVGGEALATANDEVAPPDLKEFFHVGPVDVTSDPYYTGEPGRRHFVPNVWPASPPRFAGAATACYRAMDGLVRLLMRLTALALGLEEAFFDRKVDRSIGTMRLNYYPSQATPPASGQLRAGAHTDYGGFTILSGEDVPGGLQILARDSGWVDVRTAPTAFVVNIGDLLMRWTNDRWLSTLHRVVNPPWTGEPSAPRLSIAFFNHPNHDVVVECIAPPGRAKHAPVLSGEYRDLKYAKTGLVPSGAATPEESR
ncbi:MAG: isopenicillin N synthase family oxygenase [Candidatus Rokubacteria bacterium]|nr:isopenicillin N synthase family oxygenase [Candidatus Rokubacteria bacterium]